MEKEIKITRCYSCPFIKTTMDGLECVHPYWENKKGFDSMVYFENNFTISKNCPLKNEQLTIIYKLF